MQQVVRRRSASAVLSVVLAVVLASGCTISKNPVSGNRRAMGYSWDQEKKLGQQAAQQLQPQLYDNQQLQQYVERIGERVLQESDMRGPDVDEKFRNTEFTFGVIDNTTPNAFALPGGYVYVTRGLMAHLNNEAQLAVVMGHEIGHVAARHASQRAFEQQVGQLGLIGGAILGQEALGVPAQSVMNLGGTAAKLLFLSYSREDERESDKLGVEYAAKSGYEAAQGAEFFRSLERIEEKSGQSVPGFLSTHPDPGNREQRIQELAQQWAQKTQMNTVNQDAFYGAIENMIIGENPRQGFARDETFYHPELRFQFPVPQNFQVQNTPTQVVMAGPNQRAVMIFTFAQANSARQAASDFTNQQGIQVVESGSARSNVGQAYAVVANAQAQQGQRVRLLSYFIEYGGNVYQFLGYTAQQQFNQYQDVFLRSMRGFDELTDRRILNVEPTRLSISPAQRSAPFRDFIGGETGGFARFSPEELAIINQVELNQQIEQGRPLKLPE